MKLFLFRTSAPRRFSYIPRYYNPKLEALEKRKAELGLDSNISNEERLRLRISSRWRKNMQQPSVYGPRFTYLIYAVVIASGIYMIFFTDLIDNLIRAFGVGK